MGLAGRTIAGSVQWIHSVFADLEFDEQEVIAVNDRVVVRGVMRGR